MKVNSAQTAYNIGEFSPRMDARTDYDQYPLAVSRALNLIAMPQGGLTERPGTRFVKEIKSSASKAQLYPFEPNAGDAYQLEFGNGYIRFYRDQAQLAAPTVSTAITNGAFTGAITSWTDRSTGTASIAANANRLQLLGSGDGYAWCEQSITVSGGDQSKLHIFQFTLSGKPAGTATIQVGTSSKGGELWSKSGYGIGQHTVAVTPGASPIYFQVINKQNVSLFLDDVSILSNTPLELSNTPYSATEVADIRFAQSNDVFYIFHGSYAPRKLERRGDYSWSFTTAYFEDGPWGEINPDIDLGATNLVTNAAFDGGLASWTSYSSDGSVEFDGTQSVVFFHIVPNTNGQVALIKQSVATGAANATHVMHFQAVGRGKLRIRLGTTNTASHVGTEILAATDYDPGWYSIAFIPGAATFWIEFGMEAPPSGVNHGDDVPGVGGVFLYNARANLMKASGTTGSVTVQTSTVITGSDFAPFASTDVGRMIRLEHAGREAGWGIVTAYNSTTSVDVYVYRQFASTVACEAWRMGAWSDTTGWPRAGILFQQRLIGGNTATNPETIWASQSSDFQNYRPDSWVGAANTVEDDDAFTYTLAAKRSSPIQWFAGTRKLVIGTATGQWVASSRGIALTPSDFSAEPHTSVRTAFVEPITIDTVALFVEGTKQSVFDLGYEYQIDGFRAADLNILADHIAGTEDFAQIVYQAKPYALVYGRKTDGTLGVLTYKREQRVVGWTPAQIAASSAGDAVVESISVGPGAAATGSQVYDSKNRDEVWMIVKRTINGATKRYIEVQEGYFRGPNRAEYSTRASWQTALLTAQADAVYLDSAITYSGVAASTITGLLHLLGEHVYANVNGVLQGPFTVVTDGAGGGQITGVSPTATKAQVGLQYPWRLRGLKANYGAQTGSAVGQVKQIGTMVPVLVDSYSFSYGVETTGELGRDAQFYVASAHMPTGGALFTGEVVLDKADADWETDPRLILKGTSGLPFTVLSCAFKVLTNER